MPDVAALLFGQRTRMELRGAPQAIALDAVLERSHSYSSQVATAPVEDRATVADHVVLEPRRLRIHGFASDHPANIGAALTAAATSLFGAGPAVTRSRAAADALVKAWRDRALLTVVTKMGTHADMVIERLEVPEGPGTVDAFEFTADLRQVERVKLKQVKVAGDFPPAPATDAAAGTADRGRRPTPPAPPASKSLTESLARSGK